MNIQTQPNLNDCGLFALACATELVHGCDPVLWSFNNASMQPHINGLSRSRTHKPIPLHKEEKGSVWKPSEEDIQRINILQLLYAKLQEQANDKM